MTWRASLARCAVLLVALAALYVFAVLTPIGQRWDAASLGWFGDWPTWALVPLVWARNLAPPMLLAGMLVCMVVSVARGCLAAPAIALTGVITAALWNLLLRDVLLYRPDYGAHAYTINTFPSGHAVVAVMAVVGIAILLPAAAPRRAITALAGALATFAAIGSLVAFAHRASDVVGGVLLAGALAAWVALFAPPIAGPVRGTGTTLRLVAAGALVVLPLVAAVTHVAGGPDLVDAMAFSVIVALLVAVVIMPAVRPAGAAVVM